METNCFDVIIIGSSFNGMTCALALSKISPHFKIALIEKENIFAHERQDDGRAFAISYSSLQLFKEIGIYDELQSHAGLIRDIRITDYKSPIILDFIGASANKKALFLGQIIENHHIFEALKKQILQCSNISVFCPNSYQEITLDRGVAVGLDNNLTLKASLLLACDGKFSDLRQKFALNALSKNYQQSAIVFKIKHQIDHGNIAYERFMPNGPLAILPLNHQNQSSIVWIVKSDECATLLELDQENFSQQLRKKMENCLGDVEVISTKFSYPLSLNLAEQFYFKDMLLVGDAACAIHPIAGQGFNLGIANIKILRDLIANNIASGIALNDNLVSYQYHKAARFKAKQMVMATDILNSIFESDNLLLKISRRSGLGLINLMPALKNFFIKKAGGVE